MDSTSNTNSVSSVQRKTPTKRSKPRKKPIKVVYISNPMKVNTSASEFRALVQELTGQDAELPPDPSRFPDTGSDDSGGGAGGGHPTEYSKTCVTKDDDDNTLGMMAQAELQVPIPNRIWEGEVGSSVEWFGPFDDVDHVFTAEMMENVSAILPAGALYESAQVDNQVLRSLHAV